MAMAAVEDCMQNAGEHISVVYPTNIRTQDPVLPLPKSSVYAM